MTKKGRCPKRNTVMNPTTREGGYLGTLGEAKKKECSDGKIVGAVGVFTSTLVR